MAPAEEPERSRLSKKAVVERALKLADADGLDALTIRKLAQDLGVTPMALYWHFRSKDDLLEALSISLWSEVDVTIDDKPWPAQLRHGLESLLAVLRAHPSGARLVLEHEKRNEAALRATNNALDILRRAGFGKKQAAEIARAALNTAIMLVTSEPGRLPGLSDAEAAEHMRRDMIELSLLDPAKYPRMVEHAAELASCDDPEFHYEFGVTLFMAGVEAMASGGGPDGPDARPLCGFSRIRHGLAATQPGEFPYRGALGVVKRRFRSILREVSTLLPPESEISSTKHRKTDRKRTGRWLGRRIRGGSRT